jgi:hypothetical protein
MFINDELKIMNAETSFIRCKNEIHHFYCFVSVN